MKSDKKYKLSVPIPLIPFDDSYVEVYAKMVKKMDADRVFLFAPPLSASYMPDLEQFKVWSGVLKERIALYNSMKIEAAFWMAHTIGHGGKIPFGNVPNFQKLVGSTGKEASSCFCPLDMNFRDYVCKALSIMAESGVELIMLDDDFRVNLHRPEIIVGCFCQLHLKAFKDKTGLDLSREEIVQQALSGMPNDIRSNWLDLNGGALIEFASEIEQAIHKVNKNTRIALATAMTLWSSEGVDMYELLKRFAGSTKPFLRTIGAPYWSKEPSNISWIIEYTRLQAYWAKNWDIELMSEGDTYPHTRYNCAAALLHAYQQGLFAAGLNNILNYSLVYASQPGHEQGYMNKISESLNNYQAICRFFPEDYLNLGVNPVYLPNNMMNMVLPENPQGMELSWPDEQVAVRFLSKLGIPIAYEGEGPVFLSGYGGAGLPQEELENLLSRGAIVDATAAKWLMDRDVDIGIKSMANSEVPVFEKFLDSEFSGEYLSDIVSLITSGEKIYYHCEVEEGARTISEFIITMENEAFPAVIVYENALKQRFCVFTFDIYHAKDGLKLLYNYARQEQLTRCFSWVAGKPLCVTVNGQPDVHVICRKSPDGKRIAVAVQNCHLDAIKNPVLRLNPQIKVGDKIELLPPDGDEVYIIEDFQYKNDGVNGYLTINCIIPPMGMLGVGLNQ